MDLLGDENTGAGAPAGNELDETPEWEPHPAPESEDVQVPQIAPDEGDIGTFDTAAAAEETPPDDAWSEPTPTAMSDAAAFDTPESTPDVFDTPESTPDAEDRANAFSTLQDDEPFASLTDEPSVSFGATDSGSFQPQSTSSEEASPPQEVTETTSFQPESGSGAEQPSLEEVSAGVAADNSIPEEEPFERAGRWWFKRGSELLVYNEQTGEWVPSPTPLPVTEQPEQVPAESRYGPESSARQTMTDLSDLAPEPDPEPEPHPGPDAATSTQQGFWKCPSCGAVNGSTADTCRMCFAARPAG